MGGRKVKQDGIHNGQNIRKIRRKQRAGQTKPARRLPLSNVGMTRETPVKIERGIRGAPGTSYDGLLKSEPRARHARPFFTPCPVREKRKFYGL